MGDGSVSARLDDKMVLNQKAITMIRNGQFLTNLFLKVKLLYLESFNEELITLPYSFLERFPNLNELHVNHNFCVEIFPSQEATGTNMKNYVSIKILEFNYLE